MSTVIKIGDKVTFQPRAEPGRKNPLAYKGCKVLALYDDDDGRATALIDCGFFGDQNVLVADLEPEKPDSTILSGG